MAQEQEPAKKVAKRVVKTTVVKRPVPSQSAPKIRYGRPTTSTQIQTPAQPVAKAKVSARKVHSPKPPAAPRVPRNLGKKAGATSGKIVGAVGGGVKGAGYKVGDTIYAGWSGVRTFRLPRLEQTKAAAIVGVVIGLITVVITGGLTRMFSEIRGVATGGGTWGSLTVVVVAFIAFALGEFLLAQMHVRQPRITSFLGLIMTLVLIMALFLGPIYTMWAWLIMPVLGAGTFALSHRLIAVTDNASRQI